VLILTLIVVAMLTLGAAAFFERMFAEHQAERAFGRQLQANNLVESGIEYTKAFVKQDADTIEQAGGLYANPSVFKGILVNDDPLAAFRGRFTILAPDLTTDGYYGGFRYGLENESAKLNLNTVLLADKSGDGKARDLLMTLPGMTESIADAILDWLDTDSETRAQGAENEYYAALPRPYAPRNGPLGSLDELLMVRDVTPALLYGADLNRNGNIDSNEEKLRTIDNVDNNLGELDRGWSAYLTLDSAEANVRSDGTPKIDVNMDSLEELQKKLIEVFTEDETNFILAYRQGGAYTGNEQGKEISSVKVDLKQSGKVKLNTVLDLIGVKTQIANTNQKKENQAKGPPENSRVTIKPAFPDEKGARDTYLPKLMENLAVNTSNSIPGRLNINQAPKALLKGIPGLDQSAIDRIVSTRDVAISQQHPEQKYETWLLQNDIVDLATMKKLMSLVTTGGNVFRAQIVGFFDEGGPADRVEVIIDATKSPPVVRRRLSLRNLAVGYSPEDLGVPETEDFK
jgi:DNA uptake protein ComE-like DNA-binding protein